MRGPRPVELDEWFESSQLAAADAPLEASLGALALLGLDDVLEDLRHAPSSLGSEGDQVIELGGCVGQADRAQRIRERAHDVGSVSPTASVAGACSSGSAA